MISATYTWWLRLFFRRSTIPMHVARDVHQFTRFTFALLVHTFYFCPAGTIQLLMVRHPRSLVVGGGWDDKKIKKNWHDMVYYVRQASYDPPEQPLLNREVRGRLGTRPRLATLVQIGSQSTVVLPRCGWHHRLQISTQVYCHGMAGTYKCLSLIHI